MSSCSCELCRPRVTQMSRSKHSYQGGVRHSAKHNRHGAEFRCAQCKHIISTTAPGTGHRNHCPLCLWSKHVDQNPGDRASSCQGKMEPIAVWVKNKSEWSLVHRCTNCTVVKTNRIAGDDNEFVLMSLASKPIAMPPFPLDRLS